MKTIFSDTTNISMCDKHYSSVRNIVWQTLLIDVEIFLYEGTSISTQSDTHFFIGVTNFTYRKFYYINISTKYNHIQEKKNLQVYPVWYFIASSGKSHMLYTAMHFQIRCLTLPN